MFYERITPVIGNVLRDKSVGIINSEASIRVIQYLASCGIRKFKVKDDFSISKLTEILTTHNHQEEYEISLLDDESSLDLIVGIQADSPQTEFTKVNFLLGSFSKNGQYSICFNKVPAETAEYRKNFYFNWLDLSNQLAHYAVALLLEGTFWNQKELVDNLKNKKQIFMGNQIWPWSLSAGPISTLNWSDKTTEKKDGEGGEKEAPCHGMNKSIMIAGCGSLGSVIADCLNPLVAKMILIDHKDVSPFNPVRQEYHTLQIGQKKVFALADNLLGKNLPLVSTLRLRSVTALLNGRIKELEIIPIVAELTSEKPEQFETILEAQKPDLVILATGSMHEYELADILRKKGVPHLAVRCYPRARWFEIIIVDPPYTPCFGCIRGHLYTGPMPSLTAEQEARYDPDYIEGQLEAEPATKPDSARCAEVASRIAVQMLSEFKENWFASLLIHRKTVLIGGNRVEGQDNDFCYGIKDPGQVVAFGRENINGNSACLFCGKTTQEPEQAPVLTMMSVKGE
jgi:hypothetical protein